MIEHHFKLLGLPSPANSKVEAEIIRLNQTSVSKTDTEIDKETVVYGRDLNSTDLLLLEANKSFKKIVSLILRDLKLLITAHLDKRSLVSIS